MNRFIKYLELDLSLEVFEFKKLDKEILSTVKVNEKKITSLKIKRSSILFITFNEKSEIDLKIEIYTLNNHIITLSYLLKDESFKEEFDKFKEYIKSLIL